MLSFLKKQFVTTTQSLVIFHSFFTSVKSSRSCFEYTYVKVSIVPTLKFVCVKLCLKAKIASPSQTLDIQTIDTTNPRQTDIRHDKPEMRETSINIRHKHSIRHVDISRVCCVSC